MYGKHHSEEAKEKMSESLKGENHPMYGKHLSEETRRKLSIPIVQIDPSTDKAINVWGSSMEVEREVGFYNSNINHCLKGRQKTYKGYKWMYLSEYMDKYCGIIV